MFVQFDRPIRRDLCECRGSTAELDKTRKRECLLLGSSLLGGNVTAKRERPWG
jgi:hypothetical protein